MPPTSPGEQPPGRLARLRVALRAVSLVQWVLLTMLAVGGLAFLRAFAGGEGVAVQRLAWGALAWTFPLLWDVVAVIGSTLWIAAPRGTAAFRWGVALNLGGTLVSGLATGSQSYTLARDQVPQGWPVPAFLAGFAVPVIYSILTWAASSARLALTTEATWTASTSSTASAAATDTADSEPATPLTPPWPASALPAGSGPSEDAPSSISPTWEAPGTDSSSAPTSAAPPTDPPTLPAAAGSPSRPPESLSLSFGAGTPTPAPSEPTLSGGSPPPDPRPTPEPTSGPTDPQDERSPGPTEGSTSSPRERREWAVTELLRRAEAPGAPELRPRDIDAEFGTKDGWRVLPAAREAVSAGYAPATAGAEG